MYQTHVKCFYDSNGDGIGDFKGLTEKLDYLESLGINALWLLPFYPSPLKDDGYDIADYFNVHPQYGTLRDFKEFLRAAHKRGIRVITELVINHTSDQHAWFARARTSKPNSSFRNYYVWSNTPTKFKDARIIFKDFEKSNWTWDPVAKAYFWHRFYSHQPDLNFDNPQVQKEICRMADFWLGMGVDGLRLDAVPYLFEREGTNCENLPETYEFLRKLRAHIDRKFKNKMLLAEANQWPEDASAYFGAGDICHMAFHFPLMPRMFMSMQMEDRFPIVDILEQTPQISPTNQWAIFLRNHDELTLEMVTDEERDYMYRVYAKDPLTKINLGIRRRLVPLLGNNRKKVELMNILLFSLVGSPIIYYGDEIGMGDNYYLGDRNGVRTPMQWSPDKNAGFSKVNPQSLYLPVVIDPEYRHEAVNVETQESNLSSLLWWMRRVIGIRKKFKAFSRGSLEFLFPDNPKILAFIRKHEEETILVVINLSRFSQVAEFDLSSYAGFVPQEIVSNNKFPVIRKTPYVLTFGPYDHFWLTLKKEKRVASNHKKADIPTLKVKGEWKNLFKDPLINKLTDDVLPQYLKKCRWFSRKASTIRSIRIVEKIPLSGLDSFLLLLRVSFNEGLQDQYFLPISFLPKEKFTSMMHEAPQSVIVQLQADTQEGILCDAIYHEEFRKRLLTLILQKRKVRTDFGELIFYPGKKTAGLSPEQILQEPSQLVKAEQSNTSVIYGTSLILKLYRRIEEGVNPDLEITRYLTEKTKISHISPFLGAIEYRTNSSQPMLIGLLSGFVVNHGEGWTYALDELGRYYERLLSLGEKINECPALPLSLLDGDLSQLSQLFAQSVDAMYLEMIRLLGRRTRELHDALGAETSDSYFTPENFSTLYQRSVYQSMRSQARRAFQTLSQSLKMIPKDLRKEASDLLPLEKDVMRCFQRILQKKIGVQKIRIHGDYHLGQVLFTGKDFTIIDFEGEPIRSLSERRLKRTCFRDIAGMIRSFHYAAYSALYLRFHNSPKDIELLKPWAEVWYFYVSAVFLQAYLENAEQTSFLPKDKNDTETLLSLFLLDKAIYELNYELNNRPDWIMLPIEGIRRLVGNFLAKEQLTK
ncbi:MAG: maltose alpha-D-glucosyltransferase [Candidatus Omnitrophota bacterium]